MKRTLALFAFILAACGSETEDGQRGIPIEIEYPASTTLRASVAEDHPGCVQFVSPTHVHLSWDNLRRRLMTADGDDMWRFSSAVSRPGRYVLRIEDPNTCGRGGGDGADGTVFTNKIRVNGTLLTVPTLTDSQEGPRHSFTFGVRDDGTVFN